MTSEVKKFIEDNIELIEKNNFKEVYIKAFEELSFKQVLELEESFLIAGVSEGKLSKHLTLWK